ncbi:hypothetical protein C5F50_00805 [Nitrosopumilus ureiphilus]|uniref:Glycosyltransferase RgtA/B/C/D-like domain-containing protein n=2 Tax=Nitrosopumilus ureiphilus TaxID=1470067 RepID=A0A7D5RCM0_9ARCH|nr:hypothetical protein C5F50_00805 [Nitrosopumilus ureiphilus]
MINKPIFSLSVIGLIGLVIRLYYFPFDLPIIYDSIDYFSYAVVVSQQGQLPIGWDLTNNGWPVFLSLFFSVFNSQNFLEFTYLQRFLTITISVLTIIPVYLLCNRFVDKKFAIIGAAFFAFDPRIITNSLLGIVEPSYILLGTLSLFLFLSKRFTIILLSFITLALFAIIRYEGFLILIPFLAIFFARYRKDGKIIQKMFLLSGVFFLTIFPMTYAMYEATGDDGIISPIFSGGINYVSAHIIEGIPDTDDPIYGENLEQNRFVLFVSLGIINLVKFLGWVLIPTFVLFAPIGFFLLFQNRDYKMVTIIVFGLTMLIPAFYLYGRGIEETRYLYIIFPIFCLMSSLTIKKVCEKIKKENLFIIIIISGILLSSLIFLDYKKIDYEHEKESYLIAKDIVSIAGGINHYVPESKYIHVADLENNWPEIPLPKETSYNQSFEIKKISPNSFSTLVEYIENSKDEGLTHIVTDGKQNKLEFLNDVFYNEVEFPYLIKEYDSTEKGFQYHVKAYKIDYEKFAKFQIKN